MKSAYELAMERLRATEGDAPVLNEEQKRSLAEVDARYRARLAEREIFLEQKLAEAASAGRAEEMAQIRTQLQHERARLEEEREREKERIRKHSG